MCFFPWSEPQIRSESGWGSSLIPVNISRLVDPQLGEITANFSPCQWLTWHLPALWMLFSKWCFQFSSGSVLLCFVSKVCVVFSSQGLPSSSGGKPRAAAIANGLQGWGSTVRGSLANKKYSTPSSGIWGWNLLGVRCWNPSLPSAHASVGTRTYVPDFWLILTFFKSQSKPVLSKLCSCWSFLINKRHTQCCLHCPLLCLPEHLGHRCLSESHCLPLRDYKIFKGKDYVLMRLIGDR